MATNPPKGDGHRNGAVRKRSQVLNPKNKRYTKRDTTTGRFIDQKADNKPFKGVRSMKDSGLPRIRTIFRISIWK